MFRLKAPCPETSARFVLPLKHKFRIEARASRGIRRFLVDFVPSNDAIRLSINEPNDTTIRLSLVKSASIYEMQISYIEIVKERLTLFLLPLYSSSASIQRIND
jgi:hypothetical protein